MNSLQGAFLGLVGALLAGCAQAPIQAPARLDLDRVMTVETFDPVLLSRAIFEESNRVRVDHGLQALAHMDALDAAAGEQATYLALSQTVGHHSPFPNEHNIGERITHVGLATSHAAENAIMMPARRPDEEAVRDYTYAEYAAFLLEGWMNSPTHRANMLARRGFRSESCQATRPSTRHRSSMLRSRRKYSRSRAGDDSIVSPRRDARIRLRNMSMTGFSIPPLQRVTHSPAAVPFQ